MVTTPVREESATYQLSGRPRAAEFFAGIGLVRSALQRCEVDVTFANDIEPFKAALYRENFESDHLIVGDIREVAGHQVPDIDIATASFPCVDLSLAGDRRGFLGDSSGLFWEFARVLDEMGSRRPPLLLIENVPSFLTSHGGQDLEVAIQALNYLGYRCDVLVVDASYFVPQSRRRLFLLGYPKEIEGDPFGWIPSPLRPRALIDFILDRPHLDMAPLSTSQPGPVASRLDDIVERLPLGDDRWWSADRVARFRGSLAPLHEHRVRDMIAAKQQTWATAYRRTRRGEATWEVRSDRIAGCLRTARGGSSKQALVEAGGGELRVRWMTPREYARLQGADDFAIPATVTDNQALFGFGDAVCVPAVEWVLRQCLLPVAKRWTGNPN